MSTPTRTGRGWAYVGAVLGGVVSIAANIAHSYVPPAGAPTDWAPMPGAVLGAMFWPAALFVAVEILARTAWPAGRRWTVLRFGGLVPVALVAALVSYRHLSGLLAFYGEDAALTATIGPLAVDGLMLMATGALLATGRPIEAPAETPVVYTPQPTPVDTPATPTTITPARPKATSRKTPAATPGARRLGAHSSRHADASRRHGPPTRACRRRRLPSAWACPGGP